MWNSNLTDQISWITYCYKNDKKKGKNWSKYSKNTLLKNYFDKCHLVLIILNTDDTLLNGFTIFNANNEFLP